MKQIKLYVDSKDNLNADGYRWIHLVDSVDRFYNDVRIYEKGIDIQSKDLQYDVPYLTINGKRKSFENAWKTLNPHETYKPRAL